MLLTFDNQSQPFHRAYRLSKQTFMLVLCFRHYHHKKITLHVSHYKVYTYPRGGDLGIRFSRKRNPHVA